MPKPLRSCLFAVVLSALLATTACGDDTDDSGVGPPSESPSTSTPTQTPAPFQVIEGPLARCGPQPVAAAETGFEYLKLRDQAMGQTPAITAGSGRTVVVLLHQTDGGGLCGWIEFATTLATDPDLSVLAIDLCGYGESRCTADAEPVDPVELAVGYARADLKAERIIVMGASMGGSVALISAASLPGIDSAVDLSGPVEWQGMEAVREGKTLPVPVLVAMADDEGTDQVAGAQRIVDNAPGGSEFLPAEAGHGYELLNEMDGSITPIGERVLRWLAAG